MSNVTMPFCDARGSDFGRKRIVHRGGRWAFDLDHDEPAIVSSGVKRVFAGTFCDLTCMRYHAARALVFEADACEAFGRECANLGMLSSCGVGPRLLAVTQARMEGTTAALPVILESDAGTSLAGLLGGARRNGVGRAEAVIHRKGTRERDIENEKIRYDVLAQLMAAHQARIYHRDLRCENVCVRRFGPRPQDIKATIIDFDLSVNLAGGEPHARAPLYATLFSEVPSRLLGRPVCFAPNPLELDMGYLAALLFHVERDGLLLNGSEHDPRVLEEFASYLSELPFFGYDRFMGFPQARDLIRTLDLDGVAQRLELVPVTRETFSARPLFEFARGYKRPYLDREDMDMCMESPEAALAGMIDKIAHAQFESYKSLRMAQGKPVPYERFDDQPEDLQRSNYDQAEHICEKIRAVGYALVLAEQADSARVVRAFTDEQIEMLARLEHDRFVEERLAAGWTLDSEATQSDPVRKTSPYLVPYDELSDDIQEYDREPARQLIPLLGLAGLMVVRQQ